MRKHPVAMSLALLAGVAAAGLLFGPAGLRNEPQSAQAALLNEAKQITGVSRLFGWSVAVSGDTAVAGARYDQALLLNAGAAFVFERDQGGADNWGEVMKLTASDAQAHDELGYSVAISGDTVVVGAFGKDSGGTRAGAAYVFDRNEGGADNWGEVTKLTASDAQTGDQFGESVAVSGDTVVVGAHHEDAGGSDAGAVYVFQRDQGGADNWGEVTKLTASDAQAGDELGYSVAVSGDTAVVGAHHEDAGGSKAGAAYVFDRNEGGANNWGEVTKLTASDAETFDRFGYSVAVNAVTAVVGGPREDAGGDGAGAAYVFERDEGGADNWGEVTKLTASDAQAGDQFGASVTVSGDTAVVGANHEDAGASDAGAAYVFDRNEGGAGTWGELSKLTASNAASSDWFGFSAGVSGGTAVLGAPQTEGQDDTLGTVYIFEIPLPKDQATDTDGDTIANSADLDDDNDGCTDKQEINGDPRLGGRRNPHNPWDFYDVLGPGAALPIDGVIDLPNDILGVIQHHPAGTLGYDAQFDRGSWTGPNSWNDTQGPDGVIDLPNDILGVLLQFGHSCQ
ncbi:MAG: hypothetical protein J4N98_07495 [Chloroflexi bacterium]|nr:hypothetical protein [Chloroflexota bacterium]MCI0890083.1 hypothetical protein [Chloroflexota bacterium]